MTAEALVAPARPGKRLLCELRDRFAARRAEGVTAVVELLVETSEEEPERLQLVIDDGRCRLAERRLPPTASLAIGLEDLAALVDGSVDPGALFASQRLRVSGDVLLAVRLPDFFPRRS